MVCSSNWCKITTYQILGVAPSVDNLKKSKTFWARAWVLFWLSGFATWDSQQWWELAISKAFWSYKIVWIDNWNPIFEKWNWGSSSVTLLLHQPSRASLTVRITSAEVRIRKKTEVSLHQPTDWLKVKLTHMKS